MYEGHDAPRTSEEAYLSAAGASSLKLEAHRQSAADIIALAGMNPHRTGLALMRLRSEWDKSAKPIPPTNQQIDHMAKTLPKEAEGKNAGMVALPKHGKTVYKHPKAAAKALAEQWHAHELGILLQSLKSLPGVRKALEHWLGVKDAPQIVGEVLLWWLAPKCPACHGCGVRVIAGTGGRTNGKPCSECRNGWQTGERPVPHGGLGRKVLGHINDCRSAAAKDQREGQKLKRRDTNEVERSIAKWDHQEAQAAQAAKEDAKTTPASTEAAVTHFRAAMSGKLRK